MIAFVVIINAGILFMTICFIIANLICMDFANIYKDSLINKDKFYEYKKEADFYKKMVIGCILLSVLIFVITNPFVS